MITVETVVTINAVIRGEEAKDNIGETLGINTVGRIIGRGTLDQNTVAREKSPNPCP